MLHIMTRRRRAIHIVEGVFAAAMLVASFGAPAPIAYAIDAADVQCPAPSATQDYSCTWDATVNGKKCLVGKPCMETKPECGTVAGGCISQGVCKATTACGKAPQLPSVPVQSSGSSLPAMPSPSTGMTDTPYAQPPSNSGSVTSVPSETAVSVPPVPAGSAWDQPLELQGGLAPTPAQADPLLNPTANVIPAASMNSSLLNDVSQLHVEPGNGSNFGLSGPEATPAPSSAGGSSVNSSDTFGQTNGQITTVQPSTPPQSSPSFLSQAGSFLSSAGTTIASGVSTAYSAAANAVSTAGNAIESYFNPSSNNAGPELVGSGNTVDTSQTTSAPTDDLSNHVAATGNTQTGMPTSDILNQTLAAAQQEAQNRQTTVNNLQDAIAYAKANPDSTTGLFPQYGNDFNDLTNRLQGAQQNSDLANHNLETLQAQVNTYNSTGQLSPTLANEVARVDAGQGVASQFVSTVANGSLTEAGTSFQQVGAAISQPSVANIINAPSNLVTGVVTGAVGSVLQSANNLAEYFGVPGFNPSSPTVISDTGSPIQAANAAGGNILNVTAAGAGPIAEGVSGLGGEAAAVGDVRAAESVAAGVPAPEVPIILDGTPGSNGVFSVAGTGAEAAPAAVDLRPNVAGLDLVAGPDGVLSAAPTADVAPPVATAPASVETPTPSAVQPNTGPFASNITGAQATAIEQYSNAVTASELPVPAGTAPEVVAQVQAANTAALTQAQLDLADAGLQLTPDNTQIVNANSGDVAAVRSSNGGPSTYNIPVDVLNASPSTAPAEASAASFRVL